MKQQTAVFLPGTMCDGRLFAHQIAAVQDAGWSVRVPHLAGQRDIGALVHFLLPRLPERFAAVGLSFGAIVALELVRQAPKRVSHLALLGAHPDALPPAAAEQRLAGYARALDSDFEAFVRKALLPQYLPKSLLPDSPQAQTAVAMALDAGFSVWRDQIAMIVQRRSYLDLLESIAIPALVACGEDDRVCPPQLHEEAAARMPKAQLAVLEKCAHLCTLEKPAAVSALLLELLKRT